ncbi:MAG TPA: DUF4426 domain-containing protein [Rudaea sp.]
MRAAHKLHAAIIAALILLLLLMLLPRTGHGVTEEFGDYLVRYNAIPSSTLSADAARQYGIERSSRNGLVNIAVQRRAGDQLVGATLSGSVADLTGHAHPIAFRETREGGDVDYLGQFPLDGSGAYLFTVRVTPAGSAQTYTLKFNQNYVVD